MVSKYLGFISYAHADATDLVEDLDKYLTEYTVGFETVYDGHFPEEAEDFVTSFKYMVKQKRLKNKLN